MTKRRWTKSDLIAFLEDKIQMETATQDEMEYYENYIWNNELEVNYTYKKLIREMKKEYMGN
ncbi:hypothetical protein [Metabacillus sp. Hm71]|uniref:hypothetical protein n=1 Tax=Metabacillus sp. Hm71 TaxID=3450743 RepID=UPI003F428D0A